jgi:hypothetical protein
MSSSPEHTTRSALAALQQFVRKPRERAEVCELCATAVPPHHQHLLEVDKRRIACACEACAILFGGHAEQRFKRIPRDVRILRDFIIDDIEWESLLIPINLAYFVHSTSAKRVIAQYPSPGGAMESTLDLEYWEQIVARNPVLKSFEPDVEALLVNRVASNRQYYRAPIDQCFRLVGLIRTHWRGLSGGEEVWKQIDRFFDELRLLAGEVPHA